VLNSEFIVVLSDVEDIPAGKLRPDSSQFLFYTYS
jgi:hypothetical protein